MLKNIAFICIGLICNHGSTVMGHGSTVCLKGQNASNLHVALAM